MSAITTHMGPRGLARGLRDYIERSPRWGPMALAVPVGLVAGFGSVGFGLLIDGIDWFMFDLVYDQLLGDLPRARLILIPALGALLVGPITLRFAPEARGHGVPEVMLAVETAGGRIRPRVATAKAVASALTIGSGGSVGKEGPIVQIGSAFGSTLAQSLGLSVENTRLLVASGAAGGIAATFNAPIAGVFFALEIILRHFNTRNFSVVVLAAVIATVTKVALLGDAPAIPIPEYALQGPADVPLYALLGIVCAVVAVGFIRAVYWFEDRFEELPFPPPVLMPVVGGAIIGALALVNDGVLGLGENAMDSVLRGDTALRDVTLLLGLKMLATPITIGSGGSGGVFRPSLFLGAMAGGAFGWVAHEAIPGVAVEPGAYSAVGMAAVFAGTARAPITAVLILFEMTRDYGIVLPLMVSVTVATGVAQVLSPGTIYSIKLSRRGITLSEGGQTVSVMQTIRVADAMSPLPASYATDTPVAELARGLVDDPEGIALVVDDEGRLAGVITNVDVSQALGETTAPLAAIDIATRDVRTVFADQSLHEALATLSATGLHALPVVTRDHPQEACGVLQRSDVIQAYYDKYEQTDARVRREQLSSAVGDDVRYLELQVSPQSPVAGLELSEVHLSEEAVVVAVRHEGVTLIPRGHTRLRPGDRVTVICAATAGGEVRALFDGRGPSKESGTPAVQSFE